MKSKNLLDAIGNIDSQFIIDAAPAKESDKKILRFSTKILDKKPCIAIVVAAILILSMFVIPTSRNSIVMAAQKICKMFTVGEKYNTEIVSNEDSTSISVDSEYYSLDRYIKIKENKMYFITEEKEIDITNQCSSKNYFRYDVTDKDGIKHIIFAGGTIETAGWAEFVFDSDGTYLTNFMYISSEEEWLTNAMVSINVPTGNPETDFPQD